jgi:hypothetical protein
MRVITDKESNEKLIVKLGVTTIGKKLAQCLIKHYAMKL